MEDNPAIAELLTIALEREYSISAYVSGTAFLHALQPGSAEVYPPFDLAVIDLQLPDMPGVEVISTIRQAPATQYLPILVLTGAPLHIIARVASCFSDVPIMRKPFHIEELLVVIERLMLIPAAIAEHAHHQTEAV